MTHTYKVTGMTCSGCKASVESSLGSLDGIEDVSVNLEESTVKLTMSEHIHLKELQNALADKYQISELPEKNVFKQTTAEPQKEQSELRQLFPLFLIFGYILIASVLLNMNPWSTTDFMLDFMGLFYIVFSFFKLLDLNGFPKSFSMYDPLANRIPVYGWIYPFIEVLLGLMFLFRFRIDVALVLTVVVLGITTFGVTKALWSKKTIKCACLGTALNLPMTKATFIENTIMIVMAIIMLFKIL
ncbi:heavy-metal-associated domain-containing protein [uncultured Winogradskyella sp.]|uniref:heavy-metal-associated domain-containing protein n=1 Tax=uncultured Winogradskyella sp. TaxID=395353 RepID=UPI00351662E7